MRFIWSGIYTIVSREGGQAQLPVSGDDFSWLPNGFLGEDSRLELIIESYVSSCLKDS